MQFDPSKSNIPEEYNFTQPFGVISEAPPGFQPLPSGVGVVDVGNYVEFDPLGPHPKDTHWQGPQPDGSFTVGNAIAQRTRLTPLRVPEPGAAPSSPLARLLSPFPKEEYYAVEMDLNYGSEWPRLVWQDGGPCFRPGFLGPAVDPDLPAYWLHTGVARFRLDGPGDRLLQMVVAAAYVAALAAAAAALYAIQPMLLAAVAASWVRGTLSLAKWAGLLALASVGKAWLYWPLLAGKLLDGLLARSAPELRTFAWANLALWGAYLLVSPAVWPLLPGIA